MIKNVLGVKIDDIDMEQALAMVQDWLAKAGKHYIVTPNPEMIVAAESDPEFKKLLNKADLAIPDGAGLKLAGVKNRIAGVDFMEAVVKLASEKGWTVGLLGAGPGVADKTAEVLTKKYPGLIITSVGDPTHWLSNASVLRTSPSDSLAPLVSDRGVRRSPPSVLKEIDILFVALGHGKQERWIADNLDKIPVKVAMGVGGSFDYISGEVPRAPLWLRTLGLEWLFRLIIQPWRIKRQLALVKYLMLLLIHGELFRH